MQSHDEVITYQFQNSPAVLAVMAKSATKHNWTLLPPIVCPSLYFSQFLILKFSRCSSR